MWIGLAIIGYISGVFLLIRFFQAVHQWDEDIEQLENESVHQLKHSTDFRPAA
jgi:hypothetical protein